jgi:hypothetical protein
VSSEAHLQQEIRLALGQRDDIFMFRINVGKFRPLDGGARVIQSAPEGTPDLMGVMTPGKAFGIEVKAQRGQQRDAQKKWQAAWEKRGGIYILAKSLQDVCEGLDIKLD